MFLSTAHTALALAHSSEFCKTEDLSRARKLIRGTEKDLGTDVFEREGEGWGVQVKESRLSFQGN